nr:regulatory iron-sulfur-containing complex subunit RicT [uncultured Desulfuromonas sp.]
MTQNNEEQPQSQPDETIIATVKFRSAGKQYDFDTNGLELNQGDSVVVETNRGRALGTIARPPQSVRKEDLPQDLKKVLRLATEADHNMAGISASKEKEAFDHCMERIRQRNMPMKLVKSEYLFDGSKIIFYFTADGRVDFRELVKDLAHHFHTRIEMRQIGVRDEAKLIGGIGICGRELCCGTFLTDFHPVSVRMAKQQGLALNPTKISGQCGRLLCCLGYEYDTYCKMAKKLPKPGSKTSLDGQPAEVVSTQTLSQLVTVRCEHKTVTVPLSSLNATKPVQKSDSQENKNESDTEVKDESKNAPKEKKNNAQGGKPQRPARAKAPEGRPNKNKRSGKPAQEKQNRPKKTASGQQTSSPESATEVKQRPPRKQRPNTSGPAKDKAPQQQNTGDNTDSNPDKKPSKRRNRNRRRPPRKP